MFISFSIAASFPVLIRFFSFNISVSLLCMASLTAGFFYSYLQHKKIKKNFSAKKPAVHSIAVKKEPFFNNSSLSKIEPSPENVKNIPDNFKLSHNNRKQEESKILKNKYSTFHEKETLNHTVKKHSSSLKVADFSKLTEKNKQLSGVHAAYKDIIDIEMLSYTVSEVILMDGMIAQEEGRYDDAETSFLKICIGSQGADQIAIAYYQLKSFYAEYGLYQKLEELAKIVSSIPGRDLGIYQKLIEEDMNRS